MLEIDETIDRVGQLYHAITGHKPQQGDAPFAPIPAEKDPVQYIQEQVDKLLLALSAPGATQTARAVPWPPRVAIFESASEVAICVDVPGIARDNIEVSVGPRALVVSGQRPTALPNGHVLRVAEAPLGAFRRVVPLPTGLRVDDASALLRDGVLEVRVPRDGQRREGMSRNVPVA